MKNVAEKLEQICKQLEHKEVKQCLREIAKHPVLLYNILPFTFVCIFLTLQATEVIVATEFQIGSNSQVIILCWM